MRILVSSASKHGSTAEIAERIATTVRDRLAYAGVPADVDVRPVDALDAVGGYDAVVLGSAVYTGRWMPVARDLVAREGHVLRRTQVWLFSSGPVGDPPSPGGGPTDADELVAATGALGHQVFPGRLDRHDLNLGERAVVHLVRAREGDYRDWSAVDGWAVSIAESLLAGAPAAADA